MDVLMALFLLNNQLKGQKFAQRRFSEGGIGEPINTLFGALTVSVLKNGMIVL